MPEFVKQLCREIELSAKDINEGWRFDTIFFGGGTPSLLEPRWLEKIITTLNNNFDLSNIQEITLEANPGEAPLERLTEFRRLGVNRLSMGFQSLQPELLTFLSRIHSVEDCFTTFHHARKAGFDNINVDMIFNIPGQSLQQWQDDLGKILELEPEHISAYSLTVEQNTTLFTQVNSGQIVMPNELTDLAMFDYCRRFMAKMGYEQYEISNYTKTGKECRHNLHYWSLDPYLAFGPSAHGFDGKTRWWNVRSLDEYLKRLRKYKSPLAGSETLSDSEKLNELIFNGLRTMTGISREKLNHSAMPVSFEKTLTKWQQHLNITVDTISLKEEGIKFADEIASELMVEEEHNLSRVSNF